MLHMLSLEVTLGSDWGARSVYYDYSKQNDILTAPWGILDPKDKNQ